MEYNLRNKFFDMKQTAVVTIIERIKEFNPESGVPFLKYAGIYIEYAIDQFVLQNGGVFNERINHYKLMKKVNALYYRLRDEQLPYEERLEQCRKEANLKDKDRVIQLLCEGEAFRYYESVDTSETENKDENEDYIYQSNARDNDSDPADLYQNLLFWDTVFEAINKLSYLKRCALLEFCGICMDCFSPVTTKTNHEIANEFEKCSDETVISYRKEAGNIILEKLKKARAI